MRNLLHMSLVLCVAAMVPCAVNAQEKASAGKLAGEQAMKIISPSFENGRPIPPKYTCRGEKINPALDISGVPAGANSLALVVEDPDAPSGTFIHWVAYDIPVTTTRIEEHSALGKQGRNSLGKTGYTPPCPPSGTHRYYFYLYALNAPTDLKEGATRKDLETAMQGHIVAKAELMGTVAAK